MGVPSQALSSRRQAVIRPGVRLSCAALRRLLLPVRVRRALPCAFQPTNFAPDLEIPNGPSSAESAGWARPYSVANRSASNCCFPCTTVTTVTRSASTRYMIR